MSAQHADIAVTKSSTEVTLLQHIWDEITFRFLASGEAALLKMELIVFHTEMIITRELHWHLIILNFNQVLWLTWYPTNICTERVLHCSVQELQSFLQHIRLHEDHVVRICRQLNVCGSHIQLHCHPFRVTQHEWLQRCHGDTVQKHLQVLEYGRQ